MIFTALAFVCFIWESQTILHNDYQIKIHNTFLKEIIAPVLQMEEQRY